MGCGRRERNIKEVREMEWNGRKEKARQRERQWGFSGESCYVSVTRQRRAKDKAHGGQMVESRWHPCGRKGEGHVMQ